MLESKVAILSALIGVAQNIKCGGVECDTCPFTLKNCVKFREILEDLKEGADNATS